MAEYGHSKNYEVQDLDESVLYIVSQAKSKQQAYGQEGLNPTVNNRQ